VVITKQELIDAVVKSGFDQQKAEITVEQICTTVHLAVLGRIAKQYSTSRRFESNGAKGFHFNGLGEDDLLRPMILMDLYLPASRLLAILAEKIGQGLDQQNAVVIEGIGRVTLVMKPVWVLEVEKQAEETPVS
jgi:hypothetical protein